MSKIKERLAALAEQLGLNGPLLARAQRRYKANRKRALIAHGQQVGAQLLADKARSKGHRAEATRQDKAALRCGHRAFKFHSRAQYYLGAIKRYQQRIHNLEQTQAELEAELKNLANVTIKGNAASGGTKQQRLKAVALASAAACASGKRPNFYSQDGGWDVNHCITGEHDNERSDCSSWFTSVYRSCGLADPNGARYTGGYTGTLVAAGKQIGRPEVGCAVIYGPGAGHHVELFVGPGDKTVGHGSSAVDAGIIDLFGDGSYRFFSYV